MVLRRCANAAATTREAAERCDGLLRIDGWMAGIKRVGRSCSFQSTQLALACSVPGKSAPRVAPAFSAIHHRRSWKLLCSQLSISPFPPIHIDNNGCDKDAIAAEHPQGSRSSHSLDPHIRLPRRTTTASLVLGPRPLTPCVICRFDLVHSHAVANTTALMG